MVDVKSLIGIPFEFIFYGLRDPNALGAADGLDEDSGHLINFVHARAHEFKRVDYNHERVQDDDHSH